MIEVFLAEIRSANTKSENTINAYKNDLEKYNRFLMSKKIDSLLKVSLEDLNDYLDYMKEINKSHGTINRRISSIKAFYKYAEIKGLIESNPANSIKFGKVYKKKPIFLTVEEVEKLLELPDDSQKGIRDKAIIEIFYGTGIKVSEMINLNIDDINFKMSYLMCKGVGTPRIVPMGSYAKNALEKYIMQRKAMLEESQELEGALFLNYQGNRFTRQGFWKLMKEYGEKTDFADKISPNTLRNSFAVHMLKNGANVRAVQELMGNDDMQSMEAFMDVAGVKIKDVFNKTHPRA